MTKKVVSRVPLPNFALWDHIGDRRIPLSFEMEVTARCNNNCRHCCINLPRDNRKAREDELTLDEIDCIADEAAALGSLWCLITGGEPLLREDFPDIYRMLKKKGLLVSVFTNACLISQSHLNLFRKYPPRHIEVTSYGITPETYEQVTRIPGSYAAFRHGLDLLLSGGIQVHLKAMAIRSNAKEIPAIVRFCRQISKDFFRFDPILHLRYDRNTERNMDILSERLSPEEIVALEEEDPRRLKAMQKKCGLTEKALSEKASGNNLFQCGAGCGSFTISYNGLFRLCSSLWNSDCLYNLRQGTLSEAWFDFASRVRAVTTNSKSFLQKCRLCPLMNICSWCPANADLECGRMDEWCEYFCRVAQSRSEAFGLSRNERG